VSTGLKIERLNVSPDGIEPNFARLHPARVEDFWWTTKRMHCKYVPSSY